MGFSNRTIKEVKPGKPHIVFRQGFWRVSPWKRKSGALYYEAHSFVIELNRKLNDERYSAMVEKPPRVARSERV